MSPSNWPHDPPSPPWRPPIAGSTPDQVEWRRPTPPASEITAKDIMTAAETAELLGCSTRHVYDLVGRDELPGARYLGRTIIIVRPILVDWLLTGRRF